MTHTVLFLCTGNSARSILAEAILNELGGDRFQAYSAGSYPKGEVNPGAIRILQAHGHDTAGLRSKSWDEFAGPDGPGFDLIITVCDNAAGEVCPIWPGQPTTAHWGLPDPADVDGDEAAIDRAFGQTYNALYSRLSLLTELKVEALDRLALKSRVSEIHAGAAE